MGRLEFFYSFNFFYSFLHFCFSYRLASRLCCISRSKWAVFR
jgi:hypothetical protein